MTQKRIALVVEDDPTLQRSVVERLEEELFEVHAVANHESAVRRLEELQPNIVVVDLGLPNESGYELCEHIRKQSKLVGVPILVMSERSFPEDMAHAEEAGANAFLKKPFSSKKLAKYVQALLDGRNASRPSVRRLRIT